MSQMVAIAMGVHVLDVLVRPVDAIPEGQGGLLVEEIRITAAGTAAGTALTLAKLGATTRCAGAIGRDEVGDMLLRLLERQGIDTSLIVRRDDAPTSATVLPIRPNGDRPALHVIGANQTYGPADAPWDAIAEATHLHLGAPEFMGGEAAAQILSRARESGTVTSADILAPGEGLLDWIGPVFDQLDYLLPNREQVLALTGADDLVEGARALIERGVGCVAATCGADGATIVDADDGRARARVRGRRGRHDRLRRRFLGRLPARPCPWVAIGARPRCWAAQQPGWWRRGWGATTGTSIWKRPTPSPRPKPPTGRRHPPDRA